jgi:hypothetical protein
VEQRKAAAGQRYAHTTPKKNQCPQVVKVKSATEPIKKAANYFFGQHCSRSKRAHFP